MAELATLASLEDRVRARIHESIGDLITEADLEELVKKGIRQTFFEGTTEYVGPQYNRQVETPAMIHKILAELLTERVDKAVDEWIADHEDKGAGHRRRVCSRWRSEGCIVAVQSRVSVRRGRLQRQQPAEPVRIMTMLSPCPCAMPTWYRLHLWALVAGQ